MSEISALVPEIFKFEKCVKYSNVRSATLFTQPNITSSVLNRAISVNLQ